jgi:hypothetical protein
MITGGFVATNVAVSNGKILAFVNSSQQLVIQYNTPITSANGVGQTYNGTISTSSTYANYPSGTIMSSAMTAVGSSARIVVTDATSNIGMWSIHATCQTTSPSYTWAISIL